MDRKQMLEEAFDKMEAGDDEEVAIVEEGHEEEQEGAQGGEGDGKQESSTKEDKTLEASKGGKEKEKAASVDPLEGKAKEAAKKEIGKDPAGERAAQAAGAEDRSKPPVSWKAGAKEQWAKLPVDVKQDVLRREKEIQQYISQNDHHRRFTESFGKVVQPFEHLIRAQNSTPLKAFHNLMTTAAVLATGNGEQKARLVAEIIGNYNVDIEVLDKVLSAGGHQTQHQGGGIVDPRLVQMLQPVQQFMSEVQQAKTAYQQRQEQEAADIVESFNEPYSEELSEDIADILDFAASRGQKMTINQAYEKALALNPEIAKLVAKQRVTEEARKNGGTRINKARRAASTLAGAPAGTGDGKFTPKTRRDALDAAWDEAATQ